ncbi:MAG: hypothetical protein SXA11_20425 [Cyanobacteriota bacterium]|nr:hypothetical protein [Cyanobacteriota bacterium]
MESVESNFTEVDGIRFETLVPKRVLVLPKRSLIEKLSYIRRHFFAPPLHPSPGYPVQIGIGITNNSDRPVNFKFHFALFPEIIQAESGEAIPPFGEGWLHPEQPLESDFCSTKPGETISFFCEAKIYWICGQKYGISIIFHETTFFFKSLIAGKYKLRLIYENQQKNSYFYDSFKKKTQEIEGLWTGEILTPFVDISLVGL